MALASVSPITLFTVTVSNWLPELTTILIVVFLAISSPSKGSTLKTIPSSTVSLVSSVIFKFTKPSGILDYLNGLELKISKNTWQMK